MAVAALTGGILAAGAAAFATGFTAGFGAVFTVFAAGLEAVLEAAALGATFAVFWGIALLLFEDVTVLPAFRGSFDDAPIRLFVALRLAAGAFFTVFAVFDADAFAAAPLEDTLEDLVSLFLRDFWATTIRAEPPRPC